MLDMGWPSDLLINVIRKFSLFVALWVIYFIIFERQSHFMILLKEIWREWRLKRRTRLLQEAGQIDF